MQHLAYPTKRSILRLVIKNSHRQAVKDNYKENLSPTYRNTYIPNLISFPIKCHEIPCKCPTQHLTIVSFSESAEEEEPLNAGSRFSKSPTERERILHVRKEKLLLGARRRYLERHSSNS